MSEKIRVFLADDHGVLRDGLRSVLEAQLDITVIGEAANGRDAVELVTQLKPDIAILDIMMPELTGIEAMRHIRQQQPSVQVIILSMHMADDHVLGALRAGARGYVLKEAASEEVIEAVRTVRDGRRYLSAQISDVIDTVLLQEQLAPDPLASLTPREREILQLLVDGKTNAEIGRLLSLSPKTVHTYRFRLMEKLDIHDLPGLVKFALQRGLTSLE